MAANGTRPPRTPIRTGRARAKRLLMGVVVTLLVGCQQSPPSGPVPGPTGPTSTQQLRDEADSLTARGDYAAAVAKYQAAVTRESRDVSLRFALGTALSHLDRRQETAEQFRFVMDHGQPDSPEVQAARRWLVEAGDLGETVTFAPSAGEESGAGATPLSGKLKGKTEASGETADLVTLALINLEKPNGEPMAWKTLKLGEPYEFDHIPPGTYRLKVESQKSGDVLWDLEVAATAESETMLDLTSANRKLQ